MTAFTNLGDLIPRDRDLGKIAIIDLGGKLAREVSYGQLDAMANGVARALSARGLARGERVAILSANRAEYLAAYYGIMRAGLVAVPVSFKFPRSTIHFILRDAAAKLVFCDMARAGDCPPDIPAVHFGDEEAKGFDRFLDGGPLDAIPTRPRQPRRHAGAAGWLPAGLGRQRLRRDRGWRGRLRPSFRRPAAAGNVGRLSAPEGRAPAGRGR